MTPDTRSHRPPSHSAPRDWRNTDRWLRGRLLSRLHALRDGPLTIDDDLGRRVLGDGGATGDPTTSLPVVLRVDDPAFYRALALRGSVGAAEAYRDGAWQADDLVGLVRLLVRNRDLLDRMETGSARLGGALLKAWHALRPNTRVGSRRNIAAHYDLSNDFFSLFLSDDLMYSSALWAEGDDNLQQASTRKLDRICQWLELQPDDHVVEIGTGWGGFALHAARHYGCRVTTTTISRRQHALAERRISAAGLGHRITLRLDDYRDLHGQFDKLVSIEMIEAIGAPFLDTYFAKLSSLLKPGGLALIQAITIEDHRYAQALRSVDFIKRHIFPGSFIPSIYAMLDAKARVTDLALLRMEDFGDSYALTLQAWRERFLQQADAVRALGFDDRFVRLWEFYLAYCEGGFRERSIGVAHLLMAKPGYRYRSAARAAPVYGDHTTKRARDGRRVEAARPA